MAHRQTNIPILTDVIPADEPGESGLSEQEIEALIAELQTRLASSTFNLTESLMRAAFSEMEAKVYEQISTQLRKELPELIDSLLREHLARDRDT